MTSSPIASAAIEFCKKEDWSALCAQLTRDMTEYLKQYRTPVFKDLNDHGEGWGSGSFIEFNDHKYILTNEHVARVRHAGEKLGFRLQGKETLFGIQGNHVEQVSPWDLALLPVSEGAWQSVEHTSNTIQIDQISFAHMPVANEIFVFSGFSGERTAFHFSTLFFEATTSVAREVNLPADDRWSSRFHFGLDYRPDAATAVLGDRGLPAPPGFSGSTVWNTCFVEAKMNGIDWKPNLAQVTGVIWGWSSTNGFIVATRAEHVRSFLLGVPSLLPPAAQ